MNQKFVVVTGASSGMRREFVLQIARRYGPASIWLVARRRDQLEALATLLPPGMGRVLCLDLAEAGGVAVLQGEIEAAVAAGQEFSMLVNNAGYGTYGPFVETDLAWELSMLDLNVRALTALSWTAARLLAPGAALVNVASLAAFMPLGNFAAYAASKAYVLSFTHALAAELAERGIRVMALCPGSVETEFARVASGGARQDVLHGKSAAKVVAHCLRQLDRGRRQAVMGPDWQMTALASRFFSRGFFARITWRFMKRPQAHKV